MAPFETKQTFVSRYAQADCAPRTKAAASVSGTKNQHLDVRLIGNLILTQKLSAPLLGLDVDDEGSPKVYCRMRGGMRGEP